MSIASDIILILGEAPGFRYTTRELSDVTGHRRKSVCVIARELHLKGHVASTRTGQRSVTAHYWIDEQKLEAARRQVATLLGEQACRECGCCNSWACEGGCWWVEPDLCSACAEGGQA